MKIFELTMIVLLLLGFIELIGEVPTDLALESLAVLELCAALWLFLEFIPKILKKMKHDSGFRDFVAALSLSCGLLICIAYSHPELLTEGNEWIATLILVGITGTILIANRSWKIYFAKKYGEQQEEKR